MMVCSRRAPDILGSVDGSGAGARHAGSLAGRAVVRRHYAPVSIGAFAGRYHYSSDAIAGIAVAAVVFLIDFYRM